MKHHSYSFMALVTAICFLAIACAEAPTGQVPEDLAPQFKGKPQPDPAINVVFDDSDDLGNDHNIRSDGGGTYEDGVCGVDGRFNLEDAILRLGRIKKKDQADCGGDRRHIHVQFPDEPVDGSPGEKAGWVRTMYFMNVDHVENVTGVDVPRDAAFGFMGCAHGLKFMPAESTETITVNNVLVTKNEDGTWTIASRPYPDNVAVCIPDEDNPNIEYEREYYHMTFELTVEPQ